MNRTEFLRAARDHRRLGNIAEAKALTHAILQVTPDDVEALRLCAALALYEAETELARAHLSRAYSLEPNNISILVELAEAQLASNAFLDAIANFTTAQHARPRDPAILRSLAKAYLGAGDHSTAKAAFAEVVRLVPYDTFAQHMLAALDEAQGSRRYIAELFDSYAESFDNHLTTALNYHLPSLIADAVAPYKLETMLDIGCGTGLVGAALHGQIAAMDGLDIAPQMIRKAREREIYRHLRSGDASELLTQDPSFSGPYNLVTAADVFVYIGQLETVFAAIRQVISPTGLFVFSIEHDETAPVSLRPSGRFAQSANYIYELANFFDFEIVQQRQFVVRHERDQPIPALFYLLRAK
jgi:predicted TPR repeat methyltransferase